MIYSIHQDSAGTIWVGTRNGLARYNASTQTFTRYANTGGAAGLQSNEFNIGAYAKDANGRMYFGGINGLSAFQPSSASDNRFVPPLSLVAVTQNGIPLKMVKISAINRMAWACAPFESAWKVSAVCSILKAPPEKARNFPFEFR